MLLGRVYQIGVVRKVRGNRAEVEIIRAGSCGESCVGCGLDCSGSGVTVELYNPVNARVGDRVRIQGAGGNIAALAAFTYLLPLLMMVTGMVYGSKLMKRLYPGMDANLMGLIFGIIPLILFYFILKTIGARLVSMGKNRPKIIDIIK